MSIVRLTYLYCDGPACAHRDGAGQEPFNIDPHPDDRAAALREDAKTQGWKRRKGKDYCAACAENATDATTDRKANP